MRKAISLFLVFSILVISGDIFARERKGTDLIIQKKDGTQVSGELIAVRKNSLVLFGLSPMVDVTVDFLEISKITHIKKSKLLLGTGVGFLFGLAIGTMAADFTEDENTWFDFGPLKTFAWTTAAVTSAGALVGLYAGKDETIQFEGKSDAQIQKILEKLRRKARVKNAQ